MEVSSGGLDIDPCLVFLLHHFVTDTISLDTLILFGHFVPILPLSYWVPEDQGGSQAARNYGLSGILYWIWHKLAVMGKVADHSLKYPNQFREREKTFLLRCLIFFTIYFIHKKGSQQIFMPANDQKIYHCVVLYYSSKAKLIKFLIQFIYVKDRFVPLNNRNSRKD